MKNGVGGRGPGAGERCGPSGRLLYEKPAPQARTSPWPLAPGPRPPLLSPAPRRLFS